MKKLMTLLLLSALALSSGASWAEDAADIAVDVPVGYVQSDPLPVYRATARTPDRAGF